MSSVVSIVPIVVRATGEAVDAELRSPIERSNLDDWEKKWLPIIESTAKRLLATKVPLVSWPQDIHWNWRKKMQKLQEIGGLLSNASFCIEYAGVTQGLMVANVSSNRARIAEQAGQHLVYVEYLQSAPWNRPEHHNDPHFRGIGSTLIIAAISLSRLEGFKGRIGLHSLPQADHFYSQMCGMTNLGPDATNYNLTYFEMTSDQAQKMAPL